MFRAELLKLKRSQLWVVVVILPLLAIITGSINYWSNKQALSSGWVSLFSQVFLFYSLFYFSMAVALMCAAAWRMEHQGTNWNLLRTNSTSAVSLLLAKTVVIAIPLAVMQLVLVCGTFISGLIVLDDVSMPPLYYLVIGLLAVVASFPLVVMQLLLSARLKSFAAPVAVCFAGCVAGFGVLASKPPLVYGKHVIPQALVTRMLNLGSSAVGDSDAFTFAGALPIVAAALAVGAVLILLAPKVIRMYES